jgi:hypothetical protein
MADTVAACVIERSWSGASSGFTTRAAKTASFSSPIES